MNAKKRKEKEMKRGLMTAAERRQIFNEKWEDRAKREQGKKYKPPLRPRQ